MNQVDINDVAQSLAQINRFTGHATRPYSVAEHSLLVADLARDGKLAVVQLACLMHDGTKPSRATAAPRRSRRSAQWHAFEAKQADIFRRQFGSRRRSLVYRDLINHYDLIALATERRDVTNYDARATSPWLGARHARRRRSRRSTRRSLNLNDLTRCNQVVARLARSLPRAVLQPQPASACGRASRPRVNHRSTHHDPERV
jgi:hypothetical protein